MAFAIINGIRVHYLIQGSGPPLLMFAPGGFRSVISRWTAQGGKREWKEMDALATLSKHFTCIAYDRREHQEVRAFALDHVLDADPIQGGERHGRDFR